MIREWVASPSLPFDPEVESARGELVDRELLAAGFVHRPDQFIALVAEALVAERSDVRSSGISAVVRDHVDVGRVAGSRGRNVGQEGGRRRARWNTDPAGCAS